MQRFFPFRLGDHDLPMAASRLASALSGTFFEFKSYDTNLA